jgi:DNA invertase Pin-like site-specific DNA recombinase
MMKKAAIYTRVSTQDQSVDMQVSDLRRYCEQRSFEVYKEYSDQGVSGTKDHRPALDQLMADARKRRFDVVACWRFDRWARSTKHLITALEEFRHLGIDFISFQENIDTSSPLGKAVFTIVSAIAELEKNIIVERVKAGLRNAKAKGKRLGRRPLIDARLLRTVSDMRGRGMSIRGISNELGVSKSLVHKSIKIVGQNPLNFQ